LNEFLITSATSSGELVFYDRSPQDPAEPLDGFWVRVTDQNLSAAGHVDAGYVRLHPAPLFADMARQWSGWSGELIWGRPWRENWPCDVAGTGLDMSSFESNFVPGQCRMNGA
jgi:hypothetical protein